MSQDEIPDRLADEKKELLQIYGGLLTLKLPYQSKIMPKIQSKVVKIILLYSSKFSEEFTDHLQEFFVAISAIITSGSVTASIDNDRLI